MKERPFNRRAHPDFIARWSKWAWPAIGRPSFLTKARAVMGRPASTSTLNPENKTPHENQTRTTAYSDCIGSHDIGGQCSRWPSNIPQGANRRAGGASEICFRPLFENRIRTA